MDNEILKTKVTRLKPNLYGCRVINKQTNKPIVEMQVKKNEISNAFYDMLRTLDKLGFMSRMAKASRHRGKGHTLKVKYIWF